MQTAILTATWVRLTTGSTGVGIIQGTNGEVYLGTTAPSASDPGIKLIDNWPLPVDFATFSHVWVRGTGVARLAG